MSEEKDLAKVETAIEDADIEARMIGIILENYDASPRELVKILESEGISKTEEDIQKYLQEHVMSYASGEYDLAGEEYLKVRIQIVKNTLPRVHDKLFEAFKVALAMFEEGLCKAEDVERLSKELRLRENAMFELLNPEKDKNAPLVNFNVIGEEFASQLADQIQNVADEIDGDDDSSEE